MAILECLYKYNVVNEVATPFPVKNDTLHFYKQSAYCLKTSYFMNKTPPPPPSSNFSTGTVWSSMFQHYTIFGQKLADGTIWSKILRVANSHAYGVILTHLTCYSRTHAIDKFTHAFLKNHTHTHAIKKIKSNPLILIVVRLIVTLFIVLLLQNHSLVVLKFSLLAKVKKK